MRTIDFYALKPGNPPIPTDVYASGDLNESGYDIYWTVNEFFPEHHRKKENLIKIWAMYCEADNITETQMHELFKTTLEPSYVVKTKRGFHIYYDLDVPIDCRDNPVEKADWFRNWVLKRFIPVFKADPQACDACRLLRPAFYRYWKDGIGEFHTDLVVDNQPRRYSLEVLEKYFPEIEEKKVEIYPRKIIEPTPGGGFWEKANRLDALSSLQKLSGTEHVLGEKYTIKQKRDGTYRVHCNGKPSNVWIDTRGLIGSTDRGGPAIPNWLNWYWNDWTKVAQILKDFFDIKED